MQERGFPGIDSYSASTKELIEMGWAVRDKNFPSEIYFDFPVKTESISLTGANCALNCAHCGGHYLKGMTDIKNLSDREPFELNFTSALISGGCTSKGKVPFWNKIDLLKELRKNIRLNFHVGLVDEEEIRLLKDLADVVSFDFVGDEETIHEVYGLPYKIADYIQVYQELRKNVRVIPHVTLGLRGGTWSGEEKALKILQSNGVDALVLNVLIPTTGTLYEDKSPLDLEEVIRFIANARLRFPNTPLILGCMRPKGNYRQKLDQAAVALGINRIVMPTPKARKLAEDMGLKLKRGEECCAL